jgi:hypothetical protein
MEPGDEDRRGPHVDGHATNSPEVLLEFFVVLPDTAVGSVNCAGPIIALMIANGGGDGFLQAERGQGRNFRRKVVVGRALAANGCNRQDQVADIIFPFLNRHICPGRGMPWAEWR